MDKQIITFSANEQNLVRIGGEYHYSSNKVSYIGAHFDLGANWDGFDSVRAVWFTDRINGISTVLDGEGNCTVPTEVLKKKDRVFVNLVGSIVSNGELTDRLTTYPAVALVVDSKAKVDSTETAPVTPSQFEQFVSIVQDAVANIKDIVSTTLNADYTLTFVYSDGTSYTTPSIRGERGPQGADGADGTDGNGIASAVLNSNYTLTLTFTDGTSYTTPSIRGAQGPKGDPGDVSQAQLDAAVSDLKSDITDIENDDELNRIIASLHTPFSGYTFTDVNGDVTQVLYDSSYYACPIVIDAKTVRFDLSRTKQKYIALAWTYNSYQRTIFIDLRTNFYGRLSTVYGAASYNYQVLTGFPQLDLTKVLVSNNGSGSYTISDGTNSYTFDVTESTVYTDAYAPWSFDIGFVISKDANSSPYLGKYEIETEALDRVWSMINKDGAISKVKGQEIQSALTWYKGYYNTSGVWVSDATYYSAELNPDAFSIHSLSPNTFFTITAFNGSDFVGYWSIYGAYTQYAITSDVQKFFFVEIPDDGYKHIITLHHLDNSAFGTYSDIVINAAVSQEYEAVTDRDGDYYKVAITPNDSDIIYTIDNNYVKMSGNNLYLSKDGGKTYGSALDISGLAENRIIRMRLWEDGTFNIFTPTHIYYVTNWATIAEASVYEADGVTAFVPVGIAAYTSPYFDDGRMLIDGTEVYMFGNTPYNVDLDGTTRVCLYYSIDKGHTYKVAYEFNLSETLSARHTHFAKYIKEKGCYWVGTGDTSNDCHLIQASYDLLDDEWTFETIGNGLDYKWVGFDTWGSELYYTYDNTPGKVMKCNIEDVADITKHICILDGLPNDPIGLFIGNHGDMLITLMNARSGTSPSPFTGVTDAKRMYYSKDRIKFHEIRGYVPYGAPIAGDYYCFSGVNADGKVLAIVNNGGNWTNTALNGVTVWLDDYVRMAGYLGGFRK